MSNKVLLAGAAAALALLGGCDDSQSAYPDEEQAYVDEQAGDATRKQMAADQEDAQAALRELQAKDPSVKDVYYSVNEKGEKVLNVVREEADGTSSNSVWPMVAGAGLGALGGLAMAKMMNQNGGYSNYQQQHAPQYSQRCDNRDERRRCRNGGSAAYTTALMNSNRNAVMASPTYRQNMQNRVSQWRQSPNTAPASVRAATTSRVNAAMSTGGGGRSASHSVGGGGM
uniref:Lipoprotein n=1 Tax=Pseudomonas phage HRDY3 TaxID=3236930 RepID=A0AB39CDT6_9VIRU